MSNKDLNVRERSPGAQFFSEIQWPLPSPQNSPGIPTVTSDMSSTPDDAEESVFLQGDETWVSRFNERREGPGTCDGKTVVAIADQL
jgi:hypothetical protein